jgi:hypothetical protein
MDRSCVSQCLDKFQGRVVPQGSFLGSQRQVGIDQTEIKSRPSGVLDRCFGWRHHQNSAFDADVRQRIFSNLRQIPAFGP